ncbi:MAG TPA: helix-hairpin-helix domain-containing protein [Thermoanaerobaculaceae bacterium]|nr:helix-hairpin-helix domain-containing protein [Thermoanaerobaculaceae bacterium]
MDERRRVAAVLEELAMLAELDGENPFKVRAMANAARTVLRQPGDLAETVARGELTGIPGIGKGIAALIVETLDRGEPVQLVELREKLPPGLPDLLSLPGLGAKRVRTLWQELGITTPGELEYACRENRLVTLAGFGPAIQKKLLDAIEFRRHAADKHHLSTGWEAAEAALAALQQALPSGRLAVAGEVRRYCEVITEVVLVCAGAPSARVKAALVEVLGDLAISEDGVTGRSPSGPPVRVALTANESFGAALLWHTGSRDHLAQLAAHAARERLTLAGGTLSDAGGGAVPCADEAEAYRKLGLPWIPPELREGTGEVEAAAKGTLPVLIEEADLLGAVHAHTTDSDGTASLAEMAAAAAELGWSLLGIADHSQVAAYAHGLDSDRLRAQGKAIEAHNARGGKPLLLRGLEADILPDGALDLPKEVPLDFVMASVHSSFRQSLEAQTARLVRAVSRGRGTILGHPTGRLLLAREGYPVDLEAVLQAAAKSGAAVEINAHPFRLDLDWRWVRRAVALGVPVVIAPDAHDPAGLADVRWGLGIARKGWATAKDVLNAKPWPWWR